MLKAGVKVISIMSELVLHTSCNFNNRLNLCLDQFIGEAFLLFFFEEVQLLLLSLHSATGLR